jgi:hypothetical protein
MTASPQSETLRSHITHLIEEQKYDEALPILFDLCAKNPSDHELETYRLLVLRILVLRWNLSRAATGAADSWTTAKRIIKSLASALRVPETTRLVRSLNQIRQTAEAAFSKRRTKLVMTAGAGTALLALCMIEGSNIAILPPSSLLSSTYASHATVPGLGAKPYNPNTPRLADQDDRQSAAFTEAKEGNFLPVISETSQLLPQESLPPSTAKKPTLSGTDVVKTTRQVNASSSFAKRQEPGAGLNLERSKKLAADASNGLKRASKILGHYQSRWAIPIRKSASFGADIVQEIDSGISVSVLEYVGEWAKVEVGPARVTGFVRREFLTSVIENGSNVADNSPSGEMSDDLPSESPS